MCVYMSALALAAPLVVLHPRSASARASCLAMGAFPDVADDHYDDDAAEIKAAIRAALSSGDRTAVGRLVGQLEKCNPTERPATSPLLDGCWETLYASDTADWTRGAGRVRHLIESYCPGPNAYASVLQAGPRGNRWDDVRDGRGAYVQRARHRFGSSEVRATFTWLGGEAWDIEYVSRARLLLGIPFWRRRIRGQGSLDLDHAVRPTFVDGGLCVLRVPAISAAGTLLRQERFYLLQRIRHRLWQDGSFVGLSDAPLMGFDLDP